MAREKALIWISPLSVFLYLLQESCLHITPTFFLFRFLRPSFHSPSRIIFYRNLHGYIVCFFSQSRHSSSSSCFLKLSFKRIHQPSRFWAARFSAGVITIFCMPGAGRPESSVWVQWSIIDWKVILINCRRAVTKGVLRLLPWKLCPHSLMQTRTHLQNALSGMLSSMATKCYVGFGFSRAYTTAELA